MHAVKCPFCGLWYTFSPIPIANGAAIATYDAVALECSCGAVYAPVSPRFNTEEDLDARGD